MKMAWEPFYVGSHYSAMELSHKVFARPDSGYRGVVPHHLCMMECNGFRYSNLVGENMRLRVGAFFATDHHLVRLRDAKRKPNDYWFISALDHLYL